MTRSPAIELSLHLWFKNGKPARKNMDLFNQLEEMCLKHCDLLCNRVSKNLMEIIGCSFYYGLPNPISTMRILATSGEREGMIVLQLQCLNIELKCLPFTGKNIEDAQQFIANLSFYGIRHYFCSGVSLQENNVPESHSAIVEYQQPYPHIRHKQCKMFFMKYKVEKNPIIVCPICRKYKSERLRNIKFQNVSPASRFHPKSGVPFSRLTEAEKTKRLNVMAHNSKRIKQQLKKLTKKTNI